LEKKQLFFQEKFEHNLPQKMQFPRLYMRYEELLKPFERGFKYQQKALGKLLNMPERALR
jgi:hypothetical protein